MPGQQPMLWDMPVGLQEDIGLADGTNLLAKVSKLHWLMNKLQIIRIYIVYRCSSHNMPEYS